MEITIKGQHRQLVGNPPEVDEELPHFKVFDKQGEKIKTRFLLGKVTLISVVPDITTSVCSLQTKHFNEAVDQFKDVRFLTVSTNLAQTQQKWCAAQGVKNMELVSDHEQSFGYAMKLLIPDEDVLARSVWIIDKEGKIIYRQIVSELTDEPDYDAALAALKQATEAWRSSANSVLWQQLAMNERIS